MEKLNARKKEEGKKPWGTWVLDQHEVAPGEKLQVYLCPGVSGYRMPATLVCGMEAGPTIVVTGGIHSGEYPGVAAVLEVAGDLDPGKVKGRILLIHCVNTSGFWAKTHAVVPEDGANLNANYPGDPQGGTGDRIADYFVREIFPQTDFMIDLHSGGIMEPLTPCLFFPAAAGEEVRRISLEAAKATDIPYLIASTATKGQYSYAASLGIPGLLLERGHSGACQASWVEGYIKDLTLLFHHLGVREKDAQMVPMAKKCIYHQTVYLTSDQQGLWYPQIQEDQIVDKGEVLGTIQDFFGNSLKQYLAQEKGRVFYYTSGLAVNPGDPLVAYGLEKDREDS